MKLVISTFSTSDVLNANPGWSFVWASTSAGTATLQSVSNTVDSGLTVSTTVVLPFSFTVWLATSQYSYTVNGTKIKQGSHTRTEGSKGQYVSLTGRNGNSGGSQTINLDDFNILPETFTFTSASQSVSSAITSWDTFAVNKDESYGSIGFALRSASGNSYTATSAGVIPTISTATYWQMVSSFTMSSNGNVLSLSDVTQNWFEGSGTDKAYSIFFDDKIWWCITQGNGVTVNNRVLVYDLRGPYWTIYDLPVNGFYVRNNALYFGSSLAGVVHKFGDSNSDNGASINAYWKSKDFFGGDPFANQELANISIAARSVANSTMTITYTINGSSVNTFAMNNYKANAAFTNYNKNLPSGKLANQYSVMFGNNSADQSFEVFGIQVGVRPKTWIPTP